MLFRHGKRSQAQMIIEYLMGFAAIVVVLLGIASPQGPLRGAVDRVINGAILTMHGKPPTGAVPGDTGEVPTSGDRWDASDWSACSITTCGWGTKVRTVTCLDSNSNGSFDCDPATKPETSIGCYIACGAYKWDADDFPSCTTCVETKAQQTRDVRCVSTTDGSEAPNESYCSADPKPSPTQDCPTACKKYVLVEGGWTPACPACGPATQTKEWYCYEQNWDGNAWVSASNPLPASQEYLCGNVPSPVTQACPLVVCEDYYWDAGDWQECKVGEENQAREARCLQAETGIANKDPDKDPAVTDDPDVGGVKKCVDADMPSLTRPCCGNGVLDEGENCDAGGATTIFRDFEGTGGCSLLSGHAEATGNVGCTDCAYDRTDCNYCGDGKIGDILDTSTGSPVERTEACDLGASQSVSCKGYNNQYYDFNDVTCENLCSSLNQTQCGRCGDGVCQDGEGGRPAFGETCICSVDCGRCYDWVDPGATCECEFVACGKNGKCYFKCLNRSGTESTNPAVDCPGLPPERECNVAPCCPTAVKDIGCDGETVSLEETEPSPIGSPIVIDCSSISACTGNVTFECNNGDGKWNQFGTCHPGCAAGSAGEICWETLPTGPVPHGTTITSCTDPALGGSSTCEGGTVNLTCTDGSWVGQAADCDEKTKCPAQIFPLSQCSNSVQITDSERPLEGETHDEDCIAPCIGTMRVKCNDGAYEIQESCTNPFNCSKEISELPAAHAEQCADAWTGLGGDTDVTYVNPGPTGDLEANCTGEKCQAYCTPPYVANSTATGCQCPASGGWQDTGVTCAKCDGAVPGTPNSTICPGDGVLTATNINQPLITRTLVDKVGNCGTPKCEYYCNADYNKVGNTCVKNPVCTGYNTPQNATACSGALTGLTVDTPWTVSNSCTGAKCQYTCNGGYVPLTKADGTAKTCIENTRDHRIGYIPVATGWTFFEYVGMSDRCNDGIKINVCGVGAWPQVIPENCGDPIGTFKVPQREAYSGSGGTPGCSTNCADVTWVCHDPQSSCAMSYRWGLVDVANTKILPDSGDHNPDKFSSLFWVMEQCCMTIRFEYWCYLPYTEEDGKY